MSKEYSPTTPIDAVINQLVKNPSGLHGEWNVSGRLTVKHLAELVSYRTQEVFFTEQNGSLWINERTSGAYEATGLRDKYENLFKREQEGRLDGHIHTFYSSQTKNRNLYNDFLSWPDVWHMIYHFNELTNPNSRNVLFHPKGALEFQMPRKDGELDIQTAQKMATQYLTDFSKKVGVVCHYKGLINGIDLDLDRVGENRARLLVEQFCREYNIIVLEAGWTDEEKIQKLVDILNLN